MKLKTLKLFTGVIFLSLTTLTWAKQPANILFIVSDDQGWGDLPANWDKTEVKLPHLDALANSGARVTNYHTVLIKVRSLNIVISLVITTSK